MPVWRLTKKQRELLAGCISVGVEGAEGKQKDIDVVMNILEELEDSEARETVVHIAPPGLYNREKERD